MASIGDVDAMNALIDILIFAMFLYVPIALVMRRPSLFFAVLCLIASYAMYSLAEPAR